MTTFVSPANAKVLQTVSSTKSSLGSALKNSVDSHKSLLGGLITLADTISKEMPLNTSTVNISKAYADEKAIIDKDLKDGKITQEESDTKLKELQDAADKELEKSKDVYYQKAPEILKYYSEAIKSFSEGAKKDLDTIEKEEAKEDIDSELNFTDWLSDITSYAESVLYGTKKAK
jgi:flagellar motor protein MotB